MKKLTIAITLLVLATQANAKRSKRLNLKDLSLKSSHALIQKTPSKITFNERNFNNRVNNTPILVGKRKGNIGPYGQYNQISPTFLIDYDRQ